MVLEECFPPVCPEGLAQGPLQVPVEGPLEEEGLVPLERGVGRVVGGLLLPVAQVVDLAVSRFQPPFLHEPGFEVLRKCQVWRLVGLLSAGVR